MQSSDKWREYSILNESFFKQVFQEQLKLGFRNSGHKYYRDWIKECEDIARLAEDKLKNYFRKGGENE